MPQVSVVIPVFRYDWELGRAIDSVLEQTFTDFEIVLVDNNATDAAREVVRKYAAAHPALIHCVHEPIQGNASARNRGIRNATAPFVALLDSDDLMMPTRLMRQVAILQESPGTVLAFSLVNRCSYDGKQIVEVGRRPRVPSWAHILRLNFCDPDLTSVMFRKDTAQAIGLFDEEFNPFWLEDTDFSLRMFQAGELTLINESLTTQRGHSDAEHGWRERNAYAWHALKNADRFFGKLREHYYLPTGQVTRRAFLQVRADWLRGSARPLFRTAHTANLGRHMLAEALRADPRDWRNWKQFLRSRLSYPTCAKLLKVPLVEAETPDWLNETFIDNIFKVDT